MLSRHLHSVRSNIAPPESCDQESDKDSIQRNVMRWIYSSNNNNARRIFCARVRGDDEGMCQKGLVLAVYSCGEQLILSPEAEKIDNQLGGKINAAIIEMCGKFKIGSSVTLTNIVSEYCAVAVVNVGPRDAGYNKLEELDESKECVRAAIGAGVRCLQQRGCVYVDVDTAEQPAAAAEAAHLAAWSFQEFVDFVDRETPCEVKPYVDATDSEAVIQEWNIGAISGVAQNWARYLIEIPPNKMTPMDFAQVALERLCPLGVRGEARDRAWMRARRMEATLAVSQGSCAPPVLLDLSYYGASADEPPVLICGEGITYDSGGLCLKSGEQLRASSGGAAGAAVAVAALQAIAELKVPINVVVLAPLCENMISGQSMKPGDVVRALNGVTIEIENTDNEGRLVLADALIYGQSEYKPNIVVDVACLTPGIQRATGGGCFGCYSNSETLWRHMRAAGADCGDRPWRFPLWKYYNKKVTGAASVDLLNMGTGKESSCLGAAFLHSFVCTDWLHLDIAGVSAPPAPPDCPAPSYLAPARHTGRPTRALVQLLCRLARSTTTTTTPT